MTPTEAIFAGWLFLLTLAVTALFAGWMGHRGAFLDLAKLFDGMAAQLKQALELLKPPAKPKRRSPRVDAPIKLVPTPDPAKPFTIDLSTPLAERAGEHYASSDGAVTASPSFRGTPKKPEGDGGGEAA